MDVLFQEKVPRGKKSGPRQWYTNFAGYAPHPEEDREAFNDLPAWRQREIQECHRIFREIPSVQAYEIIDPSTMRPYPNQKLADDYYRKIPEVALAPVPPAAKYFIPNGISLAEFRRQRVECSEGSILEALIGHVTRDRLIQIGATEDGKALARSKPLDGTIAFIWRYAQYYSGQTLAIPVTAFWDLDDGISRLTGVRGGASEEVVGFLEQKAHELVEITGGEKNVAVLRWARIMGRLD
jgi:hypothetical protein